MAPRPCLSEMIEAHESNGGNLIAVAPVPANETHKYGIVAVDDAEAKVSRITSMIERAESRVLRPRTSTFGRYGSLEPAIFPLFESQQPGAGGEIQLTDAMLRLLNDMRRPFHSVRFDGAIHDCGSKLGFLLAGFAYALADGELGPVLRGELNKLL